jgi:hypothetical protein
MRSSWHVTAPPLPCRGDESPAAWSLLTTGALRHGPAHVRIPWSRRRARSGCLLDPEGPCVLSGLLAGAEATAPLDDLVAALVAEADARFEAAVDRAAFDDRLYEALIARGALERWIIQATHKRQQRRAEACVALAFVSSAYTVPLCLLADAPVRLTVGIAMAILTAGSAVSALAFLRRTPTGWPLPQLIAGLLCATAVGVLLIVEGAMGRILVGDEVATLIGLAAAGVSLLIQAVVARLANA